MKENTYKRFRVLLDSREVARFEESGVEGMWKCCEYIHRHTSFSVLHATRHEGYSIEGYAKTWEKIEVK